MGITERRQREKHERRRAILSCTKELILSNGVERVSMEDIAAKAELSKATIYLYFTGKEMIFNQICEESAKGFLRHFKPILETCTTGFESIKQFWRGFADSYGNSEEIILLFRIRNFLNPGQPFLSMEQYGKSKFVDIIIEALKSIIDRCKNEGIFDESMDSGVATRLILTLFCSSVDNASKVPLEEKKSLALIEELAKSFQIILHGFAKEGIDRSLLNIKNT